MMAPSPVPDVCSLADAWILLHFHDIDWQRLWMQVEKWNLVPACQDLLSGVKTALNVTLPEEILQRSARFPVSWKERIQYGLRRRSSSRFNNLMAALAGRWRLYQNQGKRFPLVWSMITLPGYLQRIGGEKSLNRTILWIILRRNR
jgi:hypothetical protein